ncbi:hypothetical protein ZWY2020_033253 [Hordeum vulgare]|nr:hypothetical protein ZWY2020_033253 [Hordeum vulgare]
MGDPWLVERSGAPHAVYLLFVHLQQSPNHLCHCVFSQFDVDDTPRTTTAFLATTPDKACISVQATPLMPHIIHDDGVRPPAAVAQSSVSLCVLSISTWDGSGVMDLAQPKKILGGLLSCRCLSKSEALTRDYVWTISNSMNIDA